MHHLRHTEQSRKRAEVRCATKTLLTALLAIASAASLTLAQADATGEQPCLGAPAMQLPSLSVAQAHAQQSAPDLASQA